MRLKYCVYNDRGIVYEGSFREIESKDFKIGDWFLTHHLCRDKMVPIMQQIKDMKIAYYFNGIPQYDFIVEGGSSYKSNLLHTSLFDLIIKE